MRHESYVSLHVLLKALELLFQRARDLQSILQATYKTPLLLCDCVIRAAKDETFYIPLITTAIPQDPDDLHLRLYQCNRQLRSCRSKTNATSSSVFYANEATEY